jgi:hypothetical protein
MDGYNKRKSTFKDPNKKNNKKVKLTEIENKINLDQNPLLENSMEQGFLLSEGDNEVR